jgi:alkanesulfonate monooxygenase SsuD/methylene tetrahydromethanopterin reductase-like flavin-dependent oxidoreductase (luciferase family)
MQTVPHLPAASPKERPMIDSTVRDCHPWVAGLQGRVGFALQAVARGDEPSPGRQLIHAGILADRHGYDAFFLGDHPAWAPEAWMHLGAVALQTSHIRLGQMVAAAPYRTPLLTARVQSDLDHLSGGRSILGLGIGWNAADYGLGANEFDRMGLPYPPTRERQEALEEAINLIRGLWGPEPFTWEGRHYRAHEANVAPPVQAGGPPLVIAGGGKRTLGQVARLADCCNFGPGPAGGTDTPADAAARLAVLDEACAEHGRDPRDILRSHFTHWLITAGSEQEVEDKVARYFPNGLDPFWGAYLVRGTPEQVAAYYQGFVDAGMGYFVVQTLDPYDEETISLLMSAVAPAIQPRRN